MTDASEVILDMPEEPPRLVLLDSGGGLRSREATETASTLAAGAASSLTVAREAQEVLAAEFLPGRRFLLRCGRDEWRMRITN